MKRAIIGITGSAGCSEKDNFFHYRKSFVHKLYSSQVNSPSLNNIEIVPIFIPIEENAIAAYAQICSGLILTGGNELIKKTSITGNCSDSIFFNDRCGRASFEIELLKEFLKHNIPVLGICFGMQIINQTLGGSLKNASPMHYSSTKKTLFENHHDVRVVRSNPLGLSGVVNVNSEHSQEIDALGQGLSVAAECMTTKTIEAIYKDNYDFCCGVQWHPEQQNTQVSSQIFQSFLMAIAK